MTYEPESGKHLLGRAEGSDDSRADVAKPQPRFSGARRRALLVGCVVLAAVIGLVTYATSQGHSSDAIGADVVVPQSIGTATTFASGSSSTPSTLLPVGTVAGDVVVSIVETYPFATIGCPTGSTMGFDKVTASTNVAGCVSVVSGAQSTTSATVTPATQTSMATMAFSGVNATGTIQFAKGQAGASAPAVTTKVADEMIVGGEGSSGWQTVAGAPSGMQKGATVNDGGNSQAAIASLLVATPARFQKPWLSVPVPNTVSGVVALVPAGSTSSGSSGGSSSAPPTGVTTPPTGVAPSTPPAQVCGNTSYLNGPATAPAGCSDAEAGPEPEHGGVG